MANEIWVVSLLLVLSARLWGVLSRIMFRGGGASM